MCHSTVMQCMTFMHASATRAAEHLPEVDAAARWRARIAMRSIVAERVRCRTCRTNATGAVLSVSDAAYMITIHIALDGLSCRQGYAVSLIIHGPADLHNFCHYQASAPAGQLRSAQPTAVRRERGALLRRVKRASKTCQSMFEVRYCVIASCDGFAWYITDGQQIQQIFTIYVQYFQTVLSTACVLSVECAVAMPILLVLQQPDGICILGGMQPPAGLSSPPVLCPLQQGAQTVCESMGGRRRSRSQP